jgi:hypothetical protein
MDIDLNAPLRRCAMNNTKSPAKFRDLAAPRTIETRCEPPGVKHPLPANTLHAG